MVHALITGTSSGLGKACLNYFKDWDITQIEGRKDCDFNHPLEVYSIVKNITKPLDVIIHSAGGGFGFKDPLLYWEDFETLYRVNVLAPAEINRICVPKMIKNCGGNIIHIGSIASTQSCSSVGYSTVKAGVAAYVRNLGRELAKDNIIVTGILPGSFIADGNNWDKYTKNNEQWLDEYIRLNCPRGKLGNVDEILPLIRFLASKEATMMTGCCVPIDGGEGVTYG